MSIPGRVLFWSGPAHNEVWAIDKPTIQVAVPMDLSINQVMEYSMEFSFGTVVYSAYELFWHWNGWVRTGVVMCPDFKTSKEVENVMQVLTGLWGVQLCECGHDSAHHARQGYCEAWECGSCRFWRPLR